MGQEVWKPWKTPINVRGLPLTHVDGHSDDLAETTVALASLLGSLVSALFHHGLGRLLLGRFFLRHTLSH